MELAAAIFILVMGFLFVSGVGVMGFFIVRDVNRIQKEAKEHDERLERRRQKLEKSDRSPPKTLDDINS